MKHISIAMMLCAAVAVIALTSYEAMTRWSRPAALETAAPARDTSLAEPAKAKADAQSSAGSSAVTSAGTARTAPSAEPAETWRQTEGPAQPGPVGPDGLPVDRLYGDGGLDPDYEAFLEELEAEEAAEDAADDAVAVAPVAKAKLTEAELTALFLEEMEREEAEYEDYLADLAEQAEERRWEMEYSGVGPFSQ